MKLADRIRHFVRVEIVNPARAAGQSQVTVKAGDVHAAIGLENRMPAVCGALDAAKFCDEAGVIIIHRSGPLQGANAEWVLSL